MKQYASLETPLSLTRRPVKWRTVSLQVVLVPRIDDLQGDNAVCCRFLFICDLNLIDVNIIERNIIFFQCVTYVKCVENLVFQCVAMKSASHTCDAGSERVK